MTRVLALTAECDGGNELDAFVAEKFSELFKVRGGAE